MNTKTKTQLATLASVAMILLNTSFASKNVKYKTVDISDQKPYHQIIKDSENLQADMYYIKTYENKLMRLKMDEDQPVIVTCEQGMEEREMSMIKKVIDYYNKIFSTINENYKFEIKDKEEKDSTVINIKNKVTLASPEDTGGICAPREAIRAKDGDIYATKMLIELNWDYIKELSDPSAYYVILHEFTHAVGISDVYYQGEDKKFDIVNTKTMMNIRNGGDVNCLYPNDYAMLQSLYSNEYKKHDNYDDAIKVVNEKIDKYTKSFYKYYAKCMKEKYQAVEDITPDEIKPGSKFYCNSLSNANKKMIIEFKENGKCTYTLTNNSGKTVEQTTGDWFIENGCVFIRNINLNNAKNYKEGLDSSLTMKLMISLTKDNLGHFVLNDGVTTNFPKDFQTKENYGINH